MFKFNNRDQNNVNGVFIVNFIVNFTYSGALLLTLNIFHILHNVKYAEIRVLYWEK